MNAIVTVIGQDRVGIIAGVSTAMAKNQINILDISQTIMKDFFTMIMLVEISEENKDLKKIQGVLEETGKEFGVTIDLQRQDVYEAMHRI